MIVASQPHAHTRCWPCPIHCLHFKNIKPETKSKHTREESRMKPAHNGRTHLSSFLQTVRSSATRSSCVNSSSLSSLRSSISCEAPRLLWDTPGLTIMHWRGIRVTQLPSIYVLIIRSYVRDSSNKQPLKHRRRRSVLGDSAFG